MNISRKKNAHDTFLKSLFNYCSVIWMCCNLSLNHKINHLHERYLCMIYSYKKSSFHEFLNKYGAVYSPLKYSKARY